MRRFTVKATWAELIALYRLTMDGPRHNLRPRYNVCPTDPVDVVTAERQLVAMRCGLVPWWWNKSLKELRMATFNARAETVETKPVFRDGLKRSRCLIPMPGYYEWQNTDKFDRERYIFLSRRFGSRSWACFVITRRIWEMCTFASEASGERSAT